MSFSHLHVHTRFSVFDGLAGTEELFARAEELGMSALAITDHGTMFGVPEFLEAARKHPSVKPIVGCEVYVTQEDHRIRAGKVSSSHLILLAKNRTGYKNLLKIVSEANTAGLGKKPCVSYDFIFAHSEGLIATSACIGGDIPKAILDGNMPKAAMLAMKMKNAFGEDFYLEISEHRSRKPEFDTEVFENQRTVTEGIYTLATQLGIKVIATNDVHFVRAEDAGAHDVLLCANTGKTMDNPDRFTYSGEEFLKSEEQMREVFPEHPDAIDNTAEIVAKVERFDIRKSPSIPAFPLPEGYSRSIDYLCDVAVRGLGERGLADNMRARIRLETELETVRKMDFGMDGAWSDHLLIMWDLLNAMRDRGIEVGPGRGSAPGSLLNYALRITDVNPLEFGLLAERFFCTSRKLGTVPDIDVDFGWDGLEASYRYLQDRYGYDHVSRVITFARRSPKRALRDAFAAFGIEKDRTGEVEGFLPDPIGSATSLRRLLDREDLADLRKWFDGASEKERTAYLTADRLTGTIPETGMHACATALGREPLDECLPLRTDRDNCMYGESLISQYDGHWFESVGPEKDDILGLATLDLLKDAYMGRRWPDSLEDPAALRVFAEGDTQGVFQFESMGMRKILRQMRPDCFSDLVLLNAVYRPGPMEWIPELIKRKHAGLLQVILPGTEEILAESYGIMVYQEQLMSIVKMVAGFSGEDADRLRKAVGKKQAGVLSELREQFVSGGLANGYDRESLLAFWDDMESGGSCMFNKSHAVCYTVVAYRCAYAKARFTADFFAAALSHDSYNRQELFDDAKSHGVTVISPDVNRSGSRCISIDCLGVGRGKSCPSGVVGRRRRHARESPDRVS